MLDLSPRLVRKLAGQCEVPHCSEPCGDFNECPTHHEKSKARKRSWWQRQTAIRKATHRCRCGAKSKDGRRCRTCKETIRRNRRNKARLARPTPRLDTATQVKLEVGKDGATRTRYVPRPGQGGPSKIEARKGRRKIVSGDVLRLIHAWLEDQNEARHAEVDAMPRVQRGEEVSLDAARLVRVARLCGLVAEEADPALRGSCVTCGRAHSDE